MTQQSYVIMLEICLQIVYVEITTIIKTTYTSKLIIMDLGTQI